YVLPQTQPSRTLHGSPERGARAVRPLLPPEPRARPPSVVHRPSGGGRRRMAGARHTGAALPAPLGGGDDGGAHPLREQARALPASGLSGVRGARRPVVAGGVARPRGADGDPPDDRPPADRGACVDARSPRDPSGGSTDAGP